jgi:hypothetical protein
MASTVHMTSNPWMMIELVPVELSKISKCVLFNRQDCCADRIAGAIITLLDANNVVLKEFPAVTGASQITVTV